MIGAKPYTDVNWTRGIDQKTGRPIEYDPTKDIQAYAGVGNLSPGAPLKKVCPSILGGNNYWPSSYSPRTRLSRTRWRGRNQDMDGSAGVAPRIKLFLGVRDSF
jgi:hypothetical protein